MANCVQNLSFKLLTGLPHRRAIPFLQICAVKKADFIDLHSMKLELLVHWNYRDFEFKVLIQCRTRRACVSYDAAFGFIKKWPIKRTTKVLLPNAASSFKVWNSKQQKQRRFFLIRFLFAKNSHRKKIWDLHKSLMEDWLLPQPKRLEL